MDAGYGPCDFRLVRLEAVLQRASDGYSGGRHTHEQRRGGRASGALKWQLAAQGGRKDNIDDIHGVGRGEYRVLPHDIEDFRLQTISYKIV